MRIYISKIYTKYNIILYEKVEGWTTYHVFRFYLFNKIVQIEFFNYFKETINSSKVL